MPSAPDTIGPVTVTELWRYPVKSMQGEPVRRADVTERGIPGDRVYALVEASSGKVVSAKNPRKWGSVLQWRASLAQQPRSGAPAPPVRITFPNGREVSSADGDIDAVLSAEVGCPVSLRTTASAAPVIEESALEGPLAELAGRNAKTKDEPLALGAPAGTFFDFAPIHIVTRETLDRLGRAYGAGRFEISRFRPNVVVEGDGREERSAETAWIGTTLSVGAALRLNVVMPTPRCVMTTLAHAGMAHDPAILRTIAEHSRALIVPLRKEMPSVGVYALVERPGAIQVGDELSAAETGLLRKSAFWWTLVRNLARRTLPRASKTAP